MKTYIVGGAVRDELLGLPVKDRDHVVVGATPDDMLARGFTPVGKDFPVFLHPKTHEEYALARTERKTAPGYKGFVFHADRSVTLEQDLARRDLTINAMARAEDGALIDPFGGQQDLQARVFRHVSKAFDEDPVRILRVARFAARFTEFSIAPETQSLMRRMVQAGEVDALVPERVWQEMARGLMEAQPSRMLTVLQECGALERIMPELAALWTPSTNAGQAGSLALEAIDIAARREHILSIRVAVMMHGMGNAIDPVCRRLRVPNECRDLAVMIAREKGVLASAEALSAEAMVELLQRCDAFRKPQRFRELLWVMECVDAAQGHETVDRSACLEAQLSAVLKVAAGDIAAQVAARYPGEPQRIAQAVRDARIEALGSRGRAG